MTAVDPGVAAPAKPRKRPCRSCPYRRDVPPGIWAAEEYARLAGYDGETWEQRPAVLFCHQVDGYVCAGWAGCHDMAESLAARLAGARGIVDLAALLAYTTDVPLFASGAEAAAHGLRGLEAPEEAARAATAKIIRVRAARGQPVTVSGRRRGGPGGSTTRR